LKHIAMFQRIFEMKFEIKEKVYSDISVMDFFENNPEIEPDYLINQKLMKKYNVIFPEPKESEPCKLKIA
jgi:hypothetical protein